MITVQNVTSDGYFLSVDVPHMDEIIIVTIVMAIWVYSILQFFRQWNAWLIPAPSCEPFYSGCDLESVKNYSSSLHSQENIKLYQPWKFPSLVSLPLHPQRDFGTSLLRVPENTVQTSRSPSLPLFGNMRANNSRSEYLSISNRSDSEPTMCLSITSPLPRSASKTECGPVRRPSITVTKASVEREEERWHHGSIGSRLPSHLSLGSSNFNPTPAPTSPLSLFQDDKHWSSSPRSVTPLLFPEHQLKPTSRSRASYLSPSPSNQKLSLPHRDRGNNSNLLSPSASNQSLNLKSSNSSSENNSKMIRSPSLFVRPSEAPDNGSGSRDKQVMNTVIQMWAKQTSIESRV